jgi:hypothetical protein
LGAFWANIIIAKVARITTTNDVNSPGDFG